MAKVKTLIISFFSVSKEFLDDKKLLFEYVLLYCILLQLLTGACPTRAKTELLVWIFREVIAVIVNLDVLETNVKQVVMMLLFFRLSICLFFCFAFLRTSSENEIFQKILLANIKFIYLRI